jgi:hypothetical protein
LRVMKLVMDWANRCVTGGYYRKKLIKSAS